MAIFGGLWDAAVAIFLVLVLAEYIKVRARISKQTNWIAASGLLVVLAAASNWIGVYSGVQSVLETLFGAIAWILLLVGTLMGASALLKAK